MRAIQRLMSTPENNQDNEKTELKLQLKAHRG